jgi:hypothetical protein
MGMPNTTRSYTAVRPVCRASGRAVSLGVGRGDADSAVRTIHHALFSRVPSDALHA